jgi:hypothetical protein
MYDPRVNPGTRTLVAYAAFAAVAAALLVSLVVVARDRLGDSTEVAESEPETRTCISEPDPTPAPGSRSEEPHGGPTFDLDGIAVTLPVGFSLSVPGWPFSDGVTLYVPSDGGSNALGTARYALFVFDDASRYRPAGRSHSDPLSAFITHGVPDDVAGCVEYTYRDATSARWAFRSDAGEFYQHELVALPDGRYVEFWSHLPLADVPRQRQTAVFELIASSISLVADDQGMP